MLEILWRNEPRIEFKLEISTWILFSTHICPTEFNNKVACSIYHVQYHIVFNVMLSGIKQ